MSKISEPPFEVVYDFSNLYRAYRMARKGKRWKNPVAKVEANVLEAVRYIQMELETGTYCPGGYFEFIVHEPKERIVQTNSFKDKIVQHSLCDEILYPVLSAPFILDNYGSQVGERDLVRPRPSERLHAGLLPEAWGRRRLGAEGRRPPLFCQHPA